VEDGATVTPHLTKRASAHKEWRVHLLLIAGELILAAAVVRWIRSGHLVVFRIEVEKGTLWWTQFPWYALAAAFAGAIALVTFLCTRAQNQQQFERQQAAEQERFDRQQLDSLFVDIQNRFASESAMMRANAAIRLAEMAEMRLPGKPVVRVRENYPFFSRAASQLSAALHMEKEQAVRDEVMRALDRMTGFARGGNQALLYCQIAELADANRSAKKDFVDALARYCSLSQEVTDDDLRPLTGFAPFCLAPETALVCLRDLASSKRCHDAASVQSALRAAQRAGAAAICVWEERLRLLPDIQSSAARLIDTRTSIVLALHARCAQGMSSRLTGLAGGEPDPQATLDLQDTQLQGADLRGAQLLGAFFDDAHLQGAILAGAQLQGARLQGADLTDADLTDANLQDARYDRRTQWPAGFVPQQQGALLVP
jgi:pentapeptide repeat protein